MSDQTWAFAGDLNSDVVQRRFRRAFPELTRCVSWLNGGYYHGAEWHALLAAYVTRLQLKRAERLWQEIEDLKHLGLSEERHFDALLCEVLGFDREVLLAERMNAEMACRELQESLWKATALPSHGS